MAGNWDAIVEALRDKARGAAAGLSGEPGTVYAGAVNRGLAAGRSIMPGGGTYDQELARVLADRDRADNGASRSVIPAVRQSAAWEAAQRTAPAMAAGLSGALKPTVSVAELEALRKSLSLARRAHSAAEEGGTIARELETRLAADKANENFAGAFDERGPEPSIEPTTLGDVVDWHVGRNPRVNRAGPRTQEEIAARRFGDEQEWSQLFRDLDAERLRARGR